MSEIQVGQINSTDGSTAITTGDDGYVSFAKTQIGGRRNIIINGAMQVAQRGTSATGIGNGDSATYNTVDRWIWQYSGSITSEYTESQSTDSPDDFSFSRKFECTTAGSGHNYIEMYQPIEAQNVAHLNYGGSAAKSLTLSFWAKCSQTGTGSIFVYSADSGRSFTANYTVSVADTWEYKTVTIDGDTAGSGISNDNGEGLRISFGLSATSSYTTGTADTWAVYDAVNRYAGLTLDISSGIGEYLAITGVQLEVGTVATPFEHRSYGEELLSCMRYYTRYTQDAASERAYGPAMIGVYNTTTALNLVHQHVVPMRASATFGYSALSDFDIEPWDVAPTAMAIFSYTGKTHISLIITDPSSRTVGDCGVLACDTDAGYYEFDSEL